MTEPVLRSKRQIFRLEVSNSNGKIAKSNVRDNLQKMLKEVDALSDLSILCGNLPTLATLGVVVGVEGQGGGEMMFGLVYASFSLTKWQALKMTFFVPCYYIMIK